MSWFNQEFEVDGELDPEVFAQKQENFVSTVVKAGEMI
jgi:hypothetical protein